MDDLLRQIRAQLALGAFGPGLLPPASFGAGKARGARRTRAGRLPAGAQGRWSLLSGGWAAFGLAAKLLLLQPGQLPLEIPDLLEQLAN
jgi:hypothetical protein